MAEPTLIPPGQIGIAGLRWQRRKALEPDLVERLRQRDKNAFDLMYQRYQQQVRWHLIPLVGLDGVEDALQNAFLSAWNLIHTYDPARAGLSTWLAVIARSQATADYRSVKLRPLPVGTLRLSEREGLYEYDRQRFSCQNYPEASALERALARLCPEHRQLIDLIYFQNFPLYEAARRVGLKMVPAKGRLKRALGALGELLASEQA